MQERTSVRLGASTPVSGANSRKWSNGRTPPEGEQSQKWRATGPRNGRRQPQNWTGTPLNDHVPEVSSTCCPTASRRSVGGVALPSVGACGLASSPGRSVVVRGMLWFALSMFPVSCLGVLLSGLVFSLFLRRVQRLALPPSVVFHVAFRKHAKGGGTSHCLSTVHEALRKGEAGVDQEFPQLHHLGEDKHRTGNFSIAFLVGGGRTLTRAFSSSFVWVLVFHAAHRDLSCSSLGSEFLSLLQGLVSPGTVHSLMTPCASCSATKFMFPPLRSSSWDGFPLVTPRTMSQGCSSLHRGNTTMLNELTWFRSRNVLATITAGETRLSICHMVANSSPRPVLLSDRSNIVDVIGSRLPGVSQLARKQP